MTPADADDLLRDDPEPPVRPKLKGLWQLTGQASEDATPVEDPPKPESASPAESASSTNEPSVKSRGLWSLMGAAEPQATSTSDSLIPQSRDAELAVPLLAISPDAETRRLVAAPSRIWQWTAFGSGIASLATSPLGLLPAIWWTVPSGVLGFLAVTFAYLDWNSLSRKHREALSHRATYLGIGCGLLGLFLAPGLFAPLATSYREDPRRPVTREHLLVIGSGLDRYHTQHGQFPAGGIFRPDEHGQPRGFHGWMTALLPMIGEAELHARIDLNAPFDAPANRPAVSRQVRAFHAQGGSSHLVGDGFGVSHFAGVGGIAEHQGSQVHYGIFDRDSTVTFAEIVDGKSHTAIVGEVGYNYPAWASPENFRHVTHGLNRDPDGFGNAAKSGAMFLLADGSVRFLPNATAPEVLKKLLTRDGEEP